MIPVLGFSMFVASYAIYNKYKVRSLDEEITEGLRIRTELQKRIIIDDLINKLAEVPVDCVSHGDIVISRDEPRPELGYYTKHLLNYNISWKGSADLLDDLNIVKIGDPLKPISLEDIHRVFKGYRVYHKTINYEFDNYVTSISQ